MLSPSAIAHVGTIFIANTWYKKVNDSIIAIHYIMLHQVKCCCVCDITGQVLQCTGNRCGFITIRYLWSYHAMRNAFILVIRRFKWSYRKHLVILCFDTWKLCHCTLKSRRFPCLVQLYGVKIYHPFSLRKNDAELLVNSDSCLVLEQGAPVRIIKLSKMYKY